MKRAVSLLLSAALLLGLLSGCQKEDVKPSLEPSMEPSALTAQALAESAFPASGHEGEVERLTTEDGGEELLSAYLENAYQLEQAWQDAAVLRATGASAFEIAVLRMEDEDAAVLAASALMSYIYRRQGDFAGYAPAEADMVANGGLSQKGNFVGLFICPDPEGAESAFMAALDGTVQSGLEETSEPGASPEPSVNTEPAFKLNDLMLRLLVESACPEWEDIDPKSWSDTHDTEFDWMSEELEIKYGVAPDQYEKCVVAYWGAPSPDGWGASFQDCDYELAVFEVVDEAAGTELMEALNRYLAEKEAQLRQEGRKETAQLLADGRTARSGRYVLLAACDHSQETALLFPRAVNSSDTSDYFYRYYQGHRPSVKDPDENWPDREKFVQPGKEDMSIYDTTAILTAWEKGDPAGLSDYDRDIYDEAQSVLNGLLRDGMSDYEKELAIYGWVVDHVNYDWTHQNIMAVTPRESFTPYGGLVNRQAVCLGYAATFQLLMNLAGMDCITVAGAAFRSQEDHAWNMVKLNGEWYCVDATWDASAREQIGLTGLENWDYFNVTSDDMAESGHQWDYANTPEATAEDGGLS